MRPNLQIDDAGLYSVNEACDALAISRSTLYRYVNTGFLKYSVRRVNGRRVFKGIDLRILFQRFF